MTTRQPDVVKSRGTPLCPGCLTPYSEGTDLCSSCGRPLGMAAWVGAARGVAAEQWFAGDLVNRDRPSRFVLFGLWALWIPTVLLDLSLVFFIPSVDAVAAIPAFFVGILGAILVFRVTRNYVRATNTQAPPMA